MIKEEKTKTLKFNMNDQLERELHEWLSHLPHGKFSEDTKKFWMHEMAEAERKKFQLTPEQHIEGMKRYNEEMKKK